jgi:serine/threonine-protein kinase
MLRTRWALAAAMAFAGSLSCGSDSVTDPSILTIDAGIPGGWFRVGGTQATYVVGTDTRAHGGRYALAIGGTDTSVLRFNGVGQNLRADAYRGKRIRFRGWVKQVGIVGSDIGLWMRIDGPGVTQGFDNFSSRPLTGTADWHQVEIILDVPNDAIGIGFGALMSGRGDFLVDDLTWEIVPATGPTTNQLLDFVTSSLDSAATANAYIGQPTAPTNLNFELR